MFNQFYIDLRRSKLTILFLIIIGLIILLFLRDVLKLETFIAALLGAFTAYLGILKQTSEDDKIFKELFTSFNERYSIDINELLHKLISDPKYVLNENDKYLLINYFNICSEEYLWYLKDRIPFKVWKAWECGIIENLNISIVNEIFEKETNTKVKQKSFYGFVEYIKPKLSKHN